MVTVFAVICYAGKAVGKREVEESTVWENSARHRGYLRRGRTVGHGAPLLGTHSGASRSPSSSTLLLLTSQICVIGLFYLFCFPQYSVLCVRQPDVLSDLHWSRVPFCPVSADSGKEGVKLKYQAL